MFLCVDFSHKLLLLKGGAAEIREERKRGSSGILGGDLHPALSLSNSLILHSELLFRPMNVI